MNKTKKPSKQRKRLYKGKLHERKIVLTANLSKELRKETGKRSLMVRKDDKVKIMRGSHKKKEGRIVKVHHKKAKVFIDKMTRKKADGTEKLIPFKASNLMLIELETKDDKRLKRAKKPTSKKEEAKVTGKKKEINKEEVQKETKKVEEKPVEKKTEEETIKEGK
ncbi:MAG: 50S ribosomal protein L24 [Candidatus Diapherotrites archaeon CG10_big_fil_rev_8_21_14_0_10_31_34]|nr:MAG: 50S ribosomal protein L24 [Candidatus Diapherotrites archaeon CG10_big_fil_rev_8_21_14_0_10_31_34]